ncbi:MAG: hypothetical protein M1421_07020 [Candidatus Eremiobacteraeota bacterium]|jgi:hypothetical protein|nr:hypothetical protein [Candidatus Eremiobacteraeota bacterium]MCL5055725.1 hypothetical protein [Bacillota bacterium]
MKIFSEALAQFRDGSISEEELQKLLEGYLSIQEGDFGEIHIQQSAALSDLCEIRAFHICELLKKYIAGKISANSLSRWANILMMSDAYKIAEEATEKEEDAITEALHELASPEINGEITVERAKELLSVLLLKKLDLCGG